MPDNPYANIRPQVRFDGLLVADNVLMPAAEGELNNNFPIDRYPIPVGRTQAAFATVRFITQGSITSNTTYVVMQTDMGDDVWVDLAWCRWTGTVANGGTPSASNPAIVFCLSTIAWGAAALQASRVLGQDPGASNTNALPLGGRIRFTGKSTLVGGSASSSSSGFPGAGVGVKATIRVKLLGLS